MKNSFTIEQKTLLSMLSSMQPICTKRTTLDTTANILFNVGHKELQLKGTDLEISLQSMCILENSDVLEPQTFLVSGKRIFDIVKELDTDISFTFENNQLSLKAGKVNFALNIKEAEGFPPFPERIENLMQFDAAHLLDLLDQVAFLIPQNNANPGLNGLFLEVDKTGITMTTTDGHCLAQVHTNNYKLDEKKEWLLPRRAIFELKKLLENTDTKQVFLGVCGNQLVFSGESFNFFSKLLADKFPQYSAILQKEGFMPAQLDRSELVKTLRRSSCLLTGQFLATNFGFSKDRVSVAMQNKEVGKLAETLSVESFDGDDLDIRFYAPYLLSGLQAFNEEKITCYLKNAAKPIIFEAKHKDHELTYLVMPVSPTNN
jgi:DNA polymerase-3 subunit beta